MSPTVTLDSAQQLDRADPVAKMRERFLFPKDPQGKDVIYLCGNSLGLQPRTARERVCEVLDEWAARGVEGHIHGKRPWLPYHEELTGPMARIIGAQPQEVVVMNTLTVNIHVLLTTFYRPTGKRAKIVIEAGAFPSDRYAVESQIRLHGLDPEKVLIEWSPRESEALLREEDFETLMADEGERIACVLLGAPNYLTGQAFDLRRLASACQRAGAFFGVDLAHGAGNLPLELHDAGVDFAAWCGYKYLNGGPGAPSGIFIHERHLGRSDLPRLEGWWGTNKRERFEMKPEFSAIPTAEAWQLSNPPILSMAALLASLEVFDEVGMTALRAKSERLTAFLSALVSESLDRWVEIVTPSDPRRRGAQLSIRLKQEAFTDRSATRALQAKLFDRGVVCDFREPDILRVAPAPLYCSFEDVYRFVQILRETLILSHH